MVLKTSDYSEELLADLDSLDMWPQKVKIMQSIGLANLKGGDIFFTNRNKVSNNNL